MKTSKLEKAKKKLVGFSFNFKNGHVAMTDESQGGPNSMLEAFAFKSKVLRDPTKEQKQIFEALGIDISKSSNQSATADTTPEGKDGMSETQEKSNKALADEVAELRSAQEVMQKALKKEQAGRKLDKYGFEAADSELLTKALSELDEEGASAVYKALDTLSTKAVEKSADLADEKAPQGENALVKALKDEVGESGKAEDDDSKDPTMVEKIKARQKQIKEGEIR